MGVEPPLPDFADVYLITELMETDLCKVIGSRQALTLEHVQFFVYQVRVKSLNYSCSARTSVGILAFTAAAGVLLCRYCED